MNPLEWLRAKRGRCRQCGRRLTENGACPILERRHERYQESIVAGFEPIPYATGRKHCRYCGELLADCPHHGRLM